MRISWGVVRGKIILTIESNLTNLALFLQGRNESDELSWQLREGFFLYYEFFDPDQRREPQRMKECEEKKKEGWLGGRKKRSGRRTVRMWGMDGFRASGTQYRDSRFKFGEMS